jgi:hypothetical protein
LAAVSVQTQRLKKARAPSLNARASHSTRIPVLSMSQANARAPDPAGGSHTSVRPAQSLERAAPGTRTRPA